MNLEIFNSVLWAILFGIHLPKLFSSFLDYKASKKEMLEVQEQLNKAMQAELDVRRKVEALQR